MKKFTGIATAALVVVTGLTACGSDQPDKVAMASDNYVAVCVDQQGNRVDDSQCRTAPTNGAYVNGGMDMSSFFWGYMVASMMMPSYGAPVRNYVTYVDPTYHNVYRGGVPRSGGYVNYSTYKPMSSTVTKSSVSLKSDTYNRLYNKSPNYTKPSVKAPSGGSGSSYNKSGSTYKSGSSYKGGYSGGSSGGFRRK